MNACRDKVVEEEEVDGWKGRKVGRKEEMFGEVGGHPRQPMRGEGG